MNSIAQLEPKLVWGIFDNITKYPRPSKKEEKIAAYVIEFANNLGYEVKKDALGNILITRPASQGYENKDGFCIQAHLDMVCEKNRDVEFDFDNDSIQTWIDGDWVKAKGTTLGADNGMGLAMGMAILAQKEFPMPKFELLCTLDEETGLTGALQLGTDLLTTKQFVNLDSEEDGHFTIGCAGGLNTRGIYKFDKVKSSENLQFFEVGIKGLRGGHPGIEINDGRACSLKIISYLLHKINSQIGLELASIEGGNKHNAIPREAFAIIGIEKSKVEELNQLIANHKEELNKEWSSKEPNHLLVFEEAKSQEVIIESKVKDNLLLSFMAMPHGVDRMSPDINGLVQTSTNFAVCKTENNTVEVLTSQRSLVESEKKIIGEQVKSVFMLGGAEVIVGDGYPAWEPNINSVLLEKAKKVFINQYGKEPVIETIHAGLECGLVGDKYPGMDMISFGPTLKEVHTPDEKIQISTVANCWKLLCGIIQSL